MPDRTQGEPVIEGEREIAAGDEYRGGDDVLALDCLQRGDDLVDLNVAQHMDQHHRRDGDDRQTEKHADPVPADIFLEKSRPRAQHI